MRSRRSATLPTREAALGFRSQQVATLPARGDVMSFRSRRSATLPVCETQVRLWLLFWYGQDGQAARSSKASKAENDAPPPEIRHFRSYATTRNDTPTRKRKNLPTGTQNTAPTEGPAPFRFPAARNLPFWTCHLLRIIPHPPAQNKPGFWEVEVLQEWTRGSASLPFHARMRARSSSRFAAMRSGVRASRLRRTSGSVLDMRTLHHQPSRDQLSTLTPSSSNTRSAVGA